MAEQLAMPFGERDELQAAYRRCTGLTRVMTFDQALGIEAIERALRIMARNRRNRRGTKR